MPFQVVLRISNVLAYVATDLYVKKHPFSYINYGTRKGVSDEALMDAKEAL